MNKEEKEKLQNKSLVGQLSLCKEDINSLQKEISRLENAKNHFDNTNEPNSIRTQLNDKYAELAKLNKDYSKLQKKHNRIRLRVASLTLSFAIATGSFAGYLFHKKSLDDIRTAETISDSTDDFLKNVGIEDVDVDFQLPDVPDTDSQLSDVPNANYQHTKGQRANLFYPDSVPSDESYESFIQDLIDYKKLKNDDMNSKDVKEELKAIQSRFSENPDCILQLSRDILRQKIAKQLGVDDYTRITTFYRQFTSPSTDSEIDKMEISIDGQEIASYCKETPSIDESTVIDTIPDEIKDVLRLINEAEKKVNIRNAVPALRSAFNLDIEKTNLKVNLGNTTLQDSASTTIEEDDYER